MDPSHSYPPITCEMCPLKSRDLCRAVRSLPDQLRRGVLPRHRTVGAETRLHEEDERPDFAAVVRKGILRTERILQDGRRSILGFYVEGDLVGDVLAPVRGPALVAATDAELCILDPAALRRALNDDASLNAHFLGEAAKQHTRQLEMIWRRGVLTSRERIIAFMVLAAEFMPLEPLPDGSVVLTVTMSRKDWADFSNTTVETICRTLAYLAEKNMVETVAPGRYRIRDLAVLAKLGGLDSRAVPKAMASDEPRPSLPFSRRPEGRTTPRAGPASRVA